MPIPPNYVERVYAGVLGKLIGVYLGRAFEGQDTILAEREVGWQFGLAYTLNLQVKGNRLVAAINGEIVLEADDPEGLFNGGGIGLVCEVGRIGCDHVEVKPF